MNLKGKGPSRLELLRTQGQGDTWFIYYNLHFTVKELEPDWRAQKAGGLGMTGRRECPQGTAVGGGRGG